MQRKDEENNPSLTSIPPDITKTILGHYVGVKDMLMFGASSKRFYIETRHEAAWKQKFIAAGCEQKLIEQIIATGRIKNFPELFKGYMGELTTKTEIDFVTNISKQDTREAVAQILKLLASLNVIKTNSIATEMFIRHANDTFFKFKRSLDLNPLSIMATPPTATHIHQTLLQLETASKRIEITSANESLLDKISLILIGITQPVVHAKRKCKEKTVEVKDLMLKRITQDFNHPNGITKFEIISYYLRIAQAIRKKIILFTALNTEPANEPTVTHSQKY